MTPSPRKERWTSEVRLIWALFGVVGTLLCVLGSLMWSQVSSNSEDIRDLSTFVHRSDVVHEEVLRRLERIERKIESDAGN